MKLIKYEACIYSKFMNRIEIFFPFKNHFIFINTMLLKYSLALDVLDAFE